MSVTSDEVNYLIYRYLLESGFTHTSYAFGHESHLLKNDFKNTKVEPGALVRLLQKGLLYVEAELHLNEDGTERECTRPVSLLQPHDCDPGGGGGSSSGGGPRATLKKTGKSSSSNNTNELKRSSLGGGSRPNANTATNNVNTLNSTSSDAEKKRSKQPQQQQQQQQQQRTKESNNTSVEALPLVAVASREKPVQSMRREEDDMMDVDPSPAGAAATTDSQAPKKKTTAASEILALAGHSAEVFSCQWNPVQPHLLASVSADATARIWDLSSASNAVSSLGETTPPSSTLDQLSIPEPIVLRHNHHHDSAKESGTRGDADNSRDVTTVAWNPQGTLLATGTFAGDLRIFTVQGELRHLLQRHRGPIFSVKWNPSGTLLLSCGVDKSVVAWDVETGDIVHVFTHHEAPVLEVDWKDDSIFASCSTDQTIAIGSVAEKRVLKTLRGHTGEVNVVKWCGGGRQELLASGSDDGTAKIWSPMHSDVPVHNLTGHQKGVHTLAWTPHSSHSSSSNTELLLATASLDHTVRLWNSQTGECIHVLAKQHSDAVCSVSFHGDGGYVTSGSYDGRWNVWNVRTGQCMQSYQHGSSGIFDVAWNRAARDKLLAVAYADGGIHVVDMRRLLGH